MNRYYVNQSISKHQQHKNLGTILINPLEVNSTIKYTILFQYLQTITKTDTLTLHNLLNSKVRAWNVFIIQSAKLTRSEISHEKRTPQVIVDTPFPN